ncbi:hypothetical protein [Amycolatopsis sp. FDAARGOS 1241]|uniref:hypothetical protein n=1 Tax=Amycolatopsis sp. FDAARGOS 1241 TaxID=2778070 RepID=UPI00194E5DEF|nr:hypothetical protein [Amycolatopsis sp. FDAARGOS 1241]QRP45432.1 hypothetical protein I6J71_40890 [Amycolatopsis sp. FDAARGOS 1241]
MPRGATGFRDVGASPLPSTDRKAFAALTHDTARLLGATVEQITAPELYSTFHTATLTHRGQQQRRFAIVCHRHVPVLALAEPVTGWGPVTIIEDAVIQAALATQTSFRLLTIDELTSPLNRADLSALAKAELRQIAHWKPRTISDLLFNHWD